MYVHCNTWHVLIVCSIYVHLEHAYYTCVDTHVADRASWDTGFEDIKQRVSVSVYKVQISCRDTNITDYDAKLLLWRVRMFTH